jgi:hypothetical protein
MLTTLVRTTAFEIEMLDPTILSSVAEQMMGGLEVPVDERNE